MTASTWDDDTLDRFRKVGDPLADDVVRDIFDSGQVDAVRQLLRHLVRNDHPLVVPPDRTLPPELLAHVDLRAVETGQRGVAGREVALDVGERMFELHGPEVLMCLGCYSLPASYTARKGVQVLAQTGRLESDPKRRLIETTQMVVDVMSEGGLSLGADARTHGEGVRAAQKVRLMHAAVRRMILHHHGEAWLAQWDVPINQEDLAGTLMTFTQVVLDGLDRLGAELTPPQRSAYLYAWSAVARIVGVDDALIPADLAAARVLTDRIKARQSARSEAGDVMAAALLTMMRNELRLGWLRGLPPTLMRFFLRQDARYLAIPRRDWTAVLVAAIHGMTRVLDRVVGSNRVSRSLYRNFTRRLLSELLTVEVGPTRPNFDIPDHLARRWQLPARS